MARARAAFPAWRALAPGERAALLHALADALDDAPRGAGAARGAQRRQADRRRARRDGRWWCDTSATTRARRSALLGDTIPVAGGEAFTVREPLGVVGLIVPWNFPLVIAAWKLGPALAAGNTVVLKPAELTPLSALRFARARREAGIPDGRRQRRRRAGSVRAGSGWSSIPTSPRSRSPARPRSGARSPPGAAATIKRVTLELGGKSPNIVFADADLEAAAAAAPMAVFGNAGQDCCARSRILVQASRA